MKDYFDAVYTQLRERILAEHPGTFVASDYPNKPGEFPALLVDVENRIPQYAGGSNEIIAETVTVSMKVYTAGPGRKKLARKLIQTAEQFFTSHNFRRLTRYERSELYQSAVHAQIIRYTAKIGVNGELYRA